MTKTNYSNVQKFSISYDGENTLYQEHQITAKDLASIIEAVNTLIIESNEILNPPDKKDKTKKNIPLLTVSTPLQPGSVIIEFLLNYNLLPTTKDIAAAIGLISTSVPITGTLIELVSKTGNTPPNVIEINEQEGYSIVVDQNGRQIKSSYSAAKLLESEKVRDSLEKIVYKPTQQAKSKVSIGDISSGSEVTTITHEDHQMFKRQTIFADIPDETIITTIKFCRINLLGSDGWRFQFQDGSDNTHSIKMQDSSFISSVKAAEQQFDINTLFVAKIIVKSKRVSDNKINKTYVLQEIQKQLGGNEKII